MMDEIIRFLNLFNFIEKFLYFICTPVYFGLALWSALGSIVSFIRYKRCDTEKTEEREILWNNGSQYGMFLVFVTIIFIGTSIICAFLNLFF